MSEAPLFVFRFLRANVGLHLLQVEADGRHGIASRPKVFAREVPFLPRELASDGDGTLSLEKPDDRRHRVLRRNLDTHVHVVRQQMPLDDSALLLSSQFVEDGPESPPKVPEQGFAPSFGHEHDVILAIPS